ncbi:MAG: hypothetical protein V1872_03400 [bacterium]
MYIKKVQQYFLAKKGKGLFLSPIDCSLVDKWEKEGIPLEIVCKGIEETFKSFGNAHKQKVTSIIKCKNEILSCWEDYKLNRAEVRVTAGIENGLDIIAPLISALITSDNYCEQKREKMLSEEIAVYEAIEKDIGDLVNRLKDKSNSCTTFEVENNLKGIIDNALKDIKRIIPDNKMENLRINAEDKLANYKKRMKKDVYKETIEAIIEENLKEDYGLDKFSLLLSR